MSAEGEIRDALARFVAELEVLIEQRLVARIQEQLGIEGGGQSVKAVRRARRAERAPEPASNGDDAALDANSLRLRIANDELERDSRESVERLERRATPAVDVDDEGLDEDELED